MSLFNEPVGPGKIHYVAEKPVDDPDKTVVMEAPKRGFPWWGYLLIGLALAGLGLAFF